MEQREVSRTPGFFRIKLVKCQKLTFFYLDPGIQEWIKQNLWKTVFKKFEKTWSEYPLLNTSTHLQK